MIKIRFIESIAGLSYSYSVGEVIECSKGAAVGFLNAKVAEIVEEPADETATKPKSKKK